MLGGDRRPEGCWRDEVAAHLEPFATTLSSCAIGSPLSTCLRHQRCHLFGHYGCMDLVALCGIRYFLTLWCRKVCSNGVTPSHLSRHLPAWGRAGRHTPGHLMITQCYTASETVEGCRHMSFSVDHLNLWMVHWMTVECAVGR